MKFIDEYRDVEGIRKYTDLIHKTVHGEWNIMEVCGGQTHSIIKYGLDELLPDRITLIHGPGCPVCVTPLELLDKAMKIASKPDVIFCSFGDMLRVPGSDDDLLSVRAKGGDVRIVYSPLDCLEIAKINPSKEVVFFAVGFETTAPANAMVVYQAEQAKLRNFSMLISHVLVPPAMEVILNSTDCRVNGFLAAGHVCTVMGFNEYIPIAEKYRVPIVVTGFEPLDIMQGIFMCIQQLEQGRFEVRNQYSRSVQKDGNREAIRIINEVFTVVNRKWRGIGEIGNSGLGLKQDYSQFDAEQRFGLADMAVDEPPGCRSGLVLQGIVKPDECESFGSACTPEHPLGATMVSTEGACAAYYNYRAAGTTG